MLTTPTHQPGPLPAGSAQSPLSAIDNLLREFAADPTSASRLESQFWVALALHLKRPEIAQFRGAAAVAAILQLDRTSQQFVGACLLRALSADSPWFSDNAFKAEAYRLFDLAFSADLYPQLKLKAQEVTAHLPGSGA